MQKTVRNDRAGRVGIDDRIGRAAGAAGRRIKRVFPAAGRGGCGGRRRFAAAVRRGGCGGGRRGRCAAGDSDREADLRCGRDRKQDLCLRLRDACKDGGAALRCQGDQRLHEGIGHGVLGTDLIEIGIGLGSAAAYRGFKSASQRRRKHGGPAAARVDRCGGLRRGRRGQKRVCVLLLGILFIFEILGAELVFELRELDPALFKGKLRVGRVVAQQRIADRNGVALIHQDLQDRAVAAFQDGLRGVGGHNAVQIGLVRHIGQHPVPGGIDLAGIGLSELDVREYAAADETDGENADENDLQRLLHCASPPFRTPS